jgi:YbbR domain-containing protein
VSFVKSIFNFLRFNKKNWKAVVLCMFAAMVFWFFNALNKNYSTNINFPVTFDYDQEQYIPIKSLPSTVRMNVTGSGWDLFRRSLGFKVPPLIVPLENPADVRKIVGTTLPAIFAGQLERLKINFIITDTIRIHVEERLRKKFSIKIDSVQQYLNPDFGLVDRPILTPDTVWLEGPTKTIQKLPETLVLVLPQMNIRKDFNENIELPLGQNGLITAQFQKVNVSFDVEKFVQVDKQIKLNIINIPSRLKQGAAIKKVSCTYRLPVSTSKTFTGASLEAVVDLNNKPRGVHKLVPQIIGLPPGAVVIKTDTVLINF